MLDTQTIVPKSIGLADTFNRFKKYSHHSGLLVMKIMQKLISFLVIVSVFLGGNVLISQSAWAEGRCPIGGEFFDTCSDVVLGYIARGKKPYERGVHMGIVSAAFDEGDEVDEFEGHRRFTGIGPDGIDLAWVEHDEDPRYIGFDVCSPPEPWSTQTCEWVEQP